MQGQGDLLYSQLGDFKTTTNQYPHILILLCWLLNGCSNLAGDIVLLQMQIQNQGSESKDREECKDRSHCSTEKIKSDRFDMEGEEGEVERSK